jgi:hypothetical protein
VSDTRPDARRAVVEAQRRHASERNFFASSVHRAPRHFFRPDRFSEINQTQEYKAAKRNRKFVLTRPRDPALIRNEWRRSVKLRYAVAVAAFSLAAPLVSHAQSPDEALLSALCSDNYYEDTAGQCRAVSGRELLTVEEILEKYAIIITGDSDDELLALALEELEEMPVGAIGPRTEDAGQNDETKSEADNRPEPIASREATMIQPSFDLGDEAANDVATTGPAGRRPPTAAAPEGDSHTIE